MVRVLRFIALALLTLPVARAQYVTVHGSGIQDVSGTKLASGQICWAPTTTLGTPTGAQVGTVGQALPFAKCFPVAGGAYSGQVADTALSHPQNLCYSVTVKVPTAASSSTYQLFQCAQPSATIVATNQNWCSAASGCNTDLLPQGTAQTILPTNLPQGAVGPQGPQGVPGPAGVSPTLAPGTVTILPAGTAPSVSDSGSGTNHVFNFGIPAPAGGSGGSSSPGGTYSILTPSGAINGSNTQFSLSSAPASASVYLNGILQSPTTDYTLSGTTLTETTAPLVGDTLTVATSSIATGAGSLTPLTPAGAVNSTNTQFTVSGTVNTLLLYLNGVQQPASAYTYASPTITLTTAPQTGDILAYIPLS